MSSEYFFFLIGLKALLAYRTTLSLKFFFFLDVIWYLYLNTIFIFVFVGTYFSFIYFQVLNILVF